MGKLRELKEVISKTERLFVETDRECTTINGSDCNFYLYIKEIDNELYAGETLYSLEKMSVDEIVKYCVESLPSATELEMYLVGNRLYYTYPDHIKDKEISKVTVHLTGENLQIYFKEIYIIMKDDDLLVEALEVDENDHVIVSKRNKIIDFRNYIGLEIGYITR